TFAFVPMMVRLPAVVIVSVEEAGFTAVTVQVPAVSVAPETCVTLAANDSVPAATVTVPGLLNGTLTVVGLGPAHVLNVPRFMNVPALRAEGFLVRDRFTCASNVLPEALVHTAPF